MSLTQVSAELAAAIKSERAGVQALVEVLEIERQALTEGHTDRLSETASRKRELLLHIAHTGEHRNRLLERMGLTADRRGVESWLKTGADRAAQAEWHAFLEIAQKAQRLNRDNGVFIDASMRANQHALQSLMSAGSAVSTYGPGGRSMSPVASRSLASA